MKINTREKVLLIIMITVLIGWFSFDLVISDQVFELSERNSLLRLKTSELNDYKALIEEESTIDEVIKSSYEKVDVVASEFFNTTPQQEYILLLNDFLAMPLVKSESISFNKPEVIEINGIPFEQNIINLDFSGPYLSVMNMFKTMWGFPKEIQMDSVSMSAAGYDEISGNVSLSTYTFLAESQVVDNLYKFYIDETFMKDNPFQQMEENETLVRYLYLQDDAEQFNYSRFFEYIDIEGHWLQSEIEEYLDYGYLYLNPQLEFGPDEPISRGEFIVLVDSVYDWPTDEYETVDLTEFRDYGDLGSLESSFAKAIHRGYLSGFVEGFSDNTLRPRDPITYREVEYLIGRITGNDIFTWESITDGLRRKSGEYKNEWFTDEGQLTKAEAVYLLYYHK